MNYQLNKRFNFHDTEDDFDMEAYFDKEALVRGPFSR